MFTRSSLRSLLPGLSLAGLLLLAPPTPAQRDEPGKASPKVLAAFRKVVAKPSESVAAVLNADGKQFALATVVDADGLLVTKASLLPPKPRVKLADGQTVEATVVGIKDNFDLALIRVPAKGLKPIAWRPAKEAEAGDWVVSAGPGKDPLAVGVVSVKSRKMKVRDYPTPPNQNGGFLGVTLADADSGAKVGSVQEGSAAAKAGLKVGDVILSVDAKPIADADDLMGTLAGYKPNETVTLKVRREDKEEELKAKLGKRPAEAINRGNLQNSMGSKLSELRAGFPEILQHDTVVKPEDCGGPLVDLDGRAVGINIARGGRVESYAVPSENVLALLPDLKAGKLAPKDDAKKLEDSLKAATARVEEARAEAEQAAKNLEAAKKALADLMAELEKSKEKK